MANFAHCCVSTVDFEQVYVGWEGSHFILQISKLVLSRFRSNQEQIPKIDGIQTCLNPSAVAYELFEGI